jgi:hypothetical protein
MRPSEARARCRSDRPPEVPDQHGRFAIRHACDDKTSTCGLGGDLLILALPVRQSHIPARPKADFRKGCVAGGMPSWQPRLDAAPLHGASPRSDANSPSTGCRERIIAAAFAIDLFCERCKTSPKCKDKREGVIERAGADLRAGPKGRVQCCFGTVRTGLPPR